MTKKGLAALEKLKKPDLSEKEYLGLIADLLAELVERYT